MIKRPLLNVRNLIAAQVDVSETRKSGEGLVSYEGQFVPVEADVEDSGQVAEDAGSDGRDVVAAQMNLPSLGRNVARDLSQAAPCPGVIPRAVLVSAAPTV